ncbi:hypothetical protein GQ53DRAFT_841192 [Thozetella sp. PMI_491]|nr:hypothetical protein GQ53DRAFT_841192 [Thozetella sp. PMI_491]
MPSVFSSLLLCAALSAASPVLPRTVTSLDEAATAEAQQRDATATRAFSDVQIKTSDGRCLFVDKLSGDFRENLTPIQVAACGSTDGQGWDVITKGKHNDQSGAALIVSTLTQACGNFDPRRAAGNQVNLFSCGGRADGGGAVTTSQLFKFTGAAGPQALEPLNQAGSCLTVKGNVIDIANCNTADPNQSFTFGGAAPANGNAAGGATSKAAASSAASTAAAAATTTTSTGTKETAPANNGGGKANESTAVASSATKGTTSCTTRRRTVTVQPPAASSEAAETIPPVAGGAAVVTTSSAPAANGAIPTFNPTTPVPVSGAGGTLNPTAVAEAQAFDNTAKRTFTNVEIRAPNGQCLFIDPTAGDFRENLIPVSIVDCTGSPNEKWDVVESGKHNNKPGNALIVSSLTQGCISFDGRRQAGDTVTLFSCGGRADGSGETNADQLFPFIGEFSFAFAPSGENNKTCILPGDAGRLVSGDCPTDGSQLFSVFP